MPKQKTHKGAAKRFNLTKTGKVKRAQAFKRHILTKKLSPYKEGGESTMARVKRAVNAQKKKRKIMKLAKGYFGAKSKQYRAASEQVRRSLRYAYIGRKQKKRDFRRLWIARINAAARINGLSYSKLMNGLKVAGVDINRKMLAELAISDANAFAALAEKAKEALK